MVQLSEYNYIKNFVKLGLKGAWHEEPGAINVLMMPGVLPEREGSDPGELQSVKNIADKYNDIIIYARRNPKTGKGEVYAAGGTAEPGRHYTEVAPHPGGAAHLCWGQTPMFPFKRKNGRTVLRADATRFWRDPNMDYKQGRHEPVFTRDIGQWFHAMGTAESIGKWSAGCVGPCGGYDGAAYRQFMKWLKDHPKEKPVLVTLWGFADYCEFHRAYRHSIGPILFRPTLRKGIRDFTDYGPVRDLQNLLKKAGYDPGPIDGDWMGKTEKAFAEFQAGENLTVDGICGQRSWTKLENLVYGGNHA